MAKVSGKSWLGFLLVVGALFAVFMFFRGGLGSAPRLETVFPPRVAPGDLLVIVGSGFSPEKQENQVFLGDTPLQVVDAGAHFVAALSGPNARSGHLLVATSGRNSNRLMLQVAGGGMGAMPSNHPATGDMQQPGNAAMGRQTADGSKEETPASAHEFFGGDDVKPAPDFSLKDSKGNTVSLKDFRGRTVLVNFWASWCAPCLEEIPSLLRMQKAMPKEKLTVLAVTVDTKWEDAHKAIKPDADLLVLMDKDSSVAKSYGTVKFPESFVVDAKGNIVAKFIGSRTWDSPLFQRYFETVIPGMGSGKSGMPAGMGMPKGMGQGKGGMPTGMGMPKGMKGMKKPGNGMPQGHPPVGKGTPPGMKKAPGGDMPQGHPPIPKTAPEKTKEKK